MRVVIVEAGQDGAKDPGARSPGAKARGQAGPASGGPPNAAAATGNAAAGAGPGILYVFDGDGRLITWTLPASDPSMPAPADATARLVAGATLSDLQPFFTGQAFSDRPLAGGGFLRTVGEPAPWASTPAPAPAPAGDASGRLFAAASHDLRQPLAALSLLIGALDGQMADGQPGKNRASRDLLRSMAQAVESMRSMMDGHFDLARLEAGLIEPDSRPQAINGVLMRLALDVAPRFAERGVRFTVMPCSAMVHTDAMLLERLLHGLVANALRHTARGRVVLGCRPQGDSLRIEVWDTGRGLAPVPLQALRDELVRPGSDGYGTLGLGLALARGLARRLGLPLAVRSMEGRGTVFAVVLPRAAEARDEEPVETVAPRTGEGQGIDGAHVLVIEDDPMVLAALNALLGQWGCQVLDAESYEAALERLGPAPGPALDLIISDLRLKGAANGIVAIRQLVKALDRPVPGMILTGDTDPKRLREARLSGYLLLHKPVAPLALRAAVARLLGREKSVT